MVALFEAMQFAYEQIIIAEFSAGAIVLLKGLQMPLAFIKFCNLMGLDVCMV